MTDLNLFRLVRPIFIIGVLISSPVLANELPISNIYGDTLGCMRVADQMSGITDRPLERGGITVSATEIVGLEWSCSFGDLWPYTNGRNAYAVQGIYDGEGIPYLEQFIFDIAENPADGMMVFEADGALFRELAVCDAGDGERG